MPRLSFDTVLSSPTRGRLALWAGLGVLATALMATLVACGGGTQTAQNNNGGVGSGGTGSYTQGPVSGLGSIIVNGVEYALDARTTVVDDTGATVNADEVQLGMQVAVRGTARTAATATALAQAQATQVRVASDLVGPLTVSVSGTAPNQTQRYAVLGQPLTVTPKTALPLLALAPGEVVAVHGLADGAGGYTATRIDRVAPTVNRYKLAGVATVVADGGTNTYTVTIGSAEAVSYAALRLAGQVPDGLATGQRLRVWFGPSRVNGVWVATRLQRDEDLVSDSGEASLTGVLSAVNLARNPPTVVVDGRSVDVSALSPAARIALGQALGLRVHVEGALRNGVYVASEVESETEADIEAEDTELHGTVSAYSPVSDGSGVTATFVIRGVTVAVDGNTRGSTALSDGLCLEAKGKAFDNAGRLRLTEYERSDSCRP